MKPAADTSEVIRAEGLSFAYKDKPVLTGANLRLEAGESVAVLGANGSGKSTFVDLLVGLLRPDEGRIRTFGRDPIRARLWLTRHMSVVRQSLPFSEKVKVKDIVRLYAGFYGIERARARDTFIELGLEDSLDQFIDELSGGQKQRMSLAIGLLNDPELLVLDEPSSGLDLGAYDQLIDSIARKRRDRGMALLVISHVPDFVERTCDKVVFMRAGKLSETIDIKSYLSGSKHHYSVELNYSSGQDLGCVVEHLSSHGYNASAQSARIFCNHVGDPEVLLRVVREGGGEHLHIPTRHSVREQNLKSLYFEMTGEESEHAR